MATLLKGKIDPYNGIAVDPASIPHDADAFDASLSASLAAWRDAGRRAVWLELPQALSGHVAVAVRRGMEYHHVTGTGTAAPGLVLSAWLQDEPDKRPGYATHFVGVGGAVLNSKNELLVVRERYLIRDLWKLPGGLASPGEDLGAAAVREVREETGLETVFEGVQCYRQLPTARMGAGDIYFVCRLRAVDENAPLVREETEIAEVRWMPLDEYRALPKMPGLMRVISDALAANAPVAKPNVFPQPDGRLQYFYANPTCPAHKSKL